MKNEPVPEKDVTPSQIKWLSSERPPGTYCFYDGKGRFKFADRLPTTPRAAVERWDWVFVLTVPDGSGVSTYIEAHRPEAKVQKQDADLYLYSYQNEAGNGGTVHQLKHPDFEGRSVPLDAAPSSGITASALAQMMGLSQQSGLTGTLGSEHLKGLNHIKTIVIEARKT